MTVSTVKTVEGTVHCNFCVNPPSSAFCCEKLSPGFESWSRHKLSFSFHYYTTFTQTVLMQHFEMRRKEPKWPFWGQKGIFWPFCDFWTVPSTIPSCTVRTVPNFQNDSLTPSFRASTVRPYFDGHCTALILMQARRCCKRYFPQGLAVSMEVSEPFE